MSLVEPLTIRYVKSSSRSRSIDRVLIRLLQAMSVDEENASSVNHPPIIQDPVFKVQRAREAVKKV